MFKTNPSKALADRISQKAKPGKKMMFGKKPAAKGKFSLFKKKSAAPVVDEME